MKIFMVTLLGLVSAITLMPADTAPVQANNPVTLGWIQWDAPTGPTSSATIGSWPNNYTYRTTTSGTIAMPDGQTTVYVTFTGEIHADSYAFANCSQTPCFGQPSGFTADGTAEPNFWSIIHFVDNQTFISAAVPSLPTDGNGSPLGDRIGLIGSPTGGIQTQRVQFFSDPARTIPTKVSNIVMMLNSLGSGTTVGSWAFTQDIVILSDNSGVTGPGFTATGLQRSTVGATTVVSGQESAGVIQFIGDFSEFSWTVQAPEAWAGWNLGVSSANPPGQVSIILDTQGGTAIGRATAQVGGTVSDPGTPTRAGYTFDGWFTAPTGGTPLTFPHTHGQNADFTLYAQWTSVAAPTSTSTTVPPTSTTTTTPPVTTSAPITAPPITAPAGPPVAATQPTTTTTAPTTTVPAPVRQRDGALPRLTPGDAAVVADGAESPVEVFVEADTDLVMRGQDFELRLRGECADGCTIATTPEGREIITLEERGLANVSGYGFLPGSPVYIWLFSEPRFLGELTVAADGTFTGQVPLGDIAPGEHTLQVNGTSYDAMERSANLGVIVTAEATAAASLPQAGLRTEGAPWALLLVAFGAALALLGRRRPHTA